MKEITKTDITVEAEGDPNIRKRKKLIHKLVSRFKLPGAM